MENDLNLNNLPVELFRYIFKYMGLDNIWEIRLVSKKFYSAVKSYKIKQLWFMPYEFYLNPDQPFINIWFSTTKTISLSDHLDNSKLGLLINPSKNVFNLKYLRLEIVPRTFNIECLNKLTKLKILELNRWTLKSDRSLKLENLKALTIHFEGLSKGNLEIDAPNLHSLSIDNIFQNKMFDNGIKFKTPLSIKHLKVTTFTRVLSAFQSLECLEIGELYDVYLKDNILEFKNLHILRIHNLVQRENSVVSTNTFNSKNENLKIFLSGVKIDNDENIYTWAEENILKFQIDYYDSLEDNLNFVTSFNYCEFLKLELSYISPDIFKKFNNIQSLIINSSIEEENLCLNFIKECKNLKDLEVNNFASLQQQFYDTLPTISSLSRLTIGENRFHLDFRFILKMPCLIYLYVCQNHLMHEDLNLDSLKYLRKVQIYQFSNISKNFMSFHILKKRNNMYQLSLESTILGPLNQTFYEIVSNYKTALIEKRLSNPNY